MRYQFDSYKLYLLNSAAKGSARVKVTMKAPVQPAILLNSINVAINRYPYFAVRLWADAKGGLILSPNDRPVVLVGTSDRMPMLGSPEANGHLLFVDYRGKNIYFNISHALAGVRGYMPWVFTTVYEYVRECFGVEVDAPEIRKPDSPLLPDECDVPTLASVQAGTSVPNAYQGHGGLMLFGDMLEEYLNPFKRSYEFRTYRFEEGPVLAYARENQTTVAGAFLMLMAKALDQVFPDTVTPLCGGIVHNPAANWGMPHAHSDISTHVCLDYERSMIRGDGKIMGAYTTGQLKKQTDPAYTKSCFRKNLELMERIDQVQGLNNKRQCAQAGMRSLLPTTALSYIVSYGGIIHLGGLAEYVDSYYSLIEGNMTLTLTAMEGKIFAAFVQNIREEKYVHALDSVFFKAGLTYQMQGPFRQHLAAHTMFHADS